MAITLSLLENIFTRFTLTGQQQETHASDPNFSLIFDRLIEQLNIEPNQRVLDVMTGRGQFATGAAQRQASVLAVDYPEISKENLKFQAKRQYLKIKFEDAYPEKLPYSDSYFDSAASVFGISFAQDHHKAANEITRVTKPGGKIGTVSWTPESFIGKLLFLMDEYFPTELENPSLWGKEEHLNKLFDGRVENLQTREATHYFHFVSPWHWLDDIEAHTGISERALQSLPKQLRKTLEQKIHDLISQENVASNGTMIVPSPYLQAVMTRR